MKKKLSLVGQSPINSLRRLCRTGALFLATVPMLAGPLAQGANVYWDGTGTSWGGLTNWSTSSASATPDPTVVPGSADVAYFNMDGVSVAQTLTLDGAQSVNALRFQAGATGGVTINPGTGGAASTLTIGGNGIVTNTATGPVGISSGVILGAAQTWNLASGMAVSGFINSGGFTLTKSGSGTLTLSGVLISATNNLVINNGAVQTSQAWGGTTGQVLLGNAAVAGATKATYLIGSGTHRSRVQFRTQSGLETIAGGMNTSGTVTYNSWMHTFNGGTAYLSAAAGGQVNVDGGIIADNTSHIGNVTKIGAGTLRLAGLGSNASQPAFLGSVTVQNGTMLVGADDSGTINSGALANGAVVSNMYGGPLGYTPYSTAVKLGGSSGSSPTQVTDNIALLTDGGSEAVNRLIGHNITVENINSSGTTTLGANVGSHGLFSGTVSLNRGVNLTALSAANTVTFSGPIVDASGTNSLTVNSVGAVKLTGTNTFGGGVNLGSGWLVINNGSALGTGTLALKGGSLGTEGNSAIAVGNAVNLTGTAVISTSGGDLAINGVVTSATSTSRFVKSGSGSLTLANSSDSRANFVINNGRVILQDANGSSQTGMVYLGVNAEAGATEAGFFLSTPGDSFGNRVEWRSRAGVRETVGGLNTSGTVTFTDYLNATQPQAYAMAATGGQVNWSNNIIGNSTSSVIKVGGGTLRIGGGGANSSDRSFSGSVTISNGTLLAGFDDLGNTANGTVLANGATSLGQGGSLGYSAYSTAIKLGDAETQVSDHLALLGDGGTTGTNRLIAHDININSQNSAGTSSLGSKTGHTLFTGSITLNNHGLRLESGTGSATFTGPIIDGAGSNGITTVGSGKVVLQGANSYKGSTDVQEGILAINGDNSNATGTVLVALGASLMGTGTIGGNSVIAGVHSPGNSPGLQTFTKNLTYNAGSSVLWELAANTKAPADRGLSFDGINVGGDLSFSGSTTLSLSFNTSGSTVDWNDSLWDSDVTGTNGWLLYSGATSLDGFNNLSISATNWLDANGALFLAANPGASFTTYQDGNDIYLNYVAVPEPSSAVFILGGFGMLLSFQRLRKRVGTC